MLYITFLKTDFKAIFMLESAATTKFEGRNYAWRKLGYRTVCFHRRCFHRSLYACQPYNTNITFCGSGLLLKYSWTVSTKALNYPLFLCVAGRTEKSPRLLWLLWLLLFLYSARVVQNIPIIDVAESSCCTWLRRNFWKLWRSKNSALVASVQRHCFEFWSFWY